MAFHYRKASSESSNDTLEGQQTRHDPSRSSCWIKLYSAARLICWPATFLLLLAILGCEVSLMYSRPSSQEIGGEINQIVPGFSQEQRKFFKDNRYASDHRTMQSINASQQNWRDIMPFGGGFIEVPNHESHNLPPPMYFPELSDTAVYAVAVFHQLHCLHHLAGFIDKLTMKIRNGDLAPLDEERLLHNDHCFNYLRNALTCCGDTTLEGQAQSSEFEGPGTDGTGGVHVCRKYDEIVTWVEKRKITDSRDDP